MNGDKVAKVKSDVYEKAVAMSKEQGITIADAISRLVEAGGAMPTSCELGQFRRVLEARGVTPPRRPDWVWGVTDVLPADMLASTKLEPYAEARREAELRCAIGNELYEKLVAEHPEAVAEALKTGETEALGEAVEAVTEPEG